MQKHVHKGKQNLRDEYRSLAKDFTWVLLTLLAVLSYIVDLRFAILSNYGAYFEGAFDGIVTILAVLAAVFYIKYIRGL